MASARRPRTSAKPATKIAGGLDRDEDGVEKSKQRKRKLTDMLGPPWSEDDLEMFYQAFRKYGKDWKKVSASLHKRTAEMVEALYTTNKAYLSLPEGAASAAGLKAMMTDHYNLLDESQSAGAESSDDGVGSDERSNHIQPLKSKKTVTTLGMESSSIRSDGIVGANGFGGPSPAKRPRTNRNRPVGKRTPRFQAGNALEKRIRIIKQPVSKLQNRVEEVSESDVAAARTLVSKQTASPSASNTPSRRSLRQTSLHQNGDKETLWRTESDASVKPTASTSQADTQLEGSPESKEIQNEGATKASSSTLRSDGDRKTPTVGDVKSKLKKPLSKNFKSQNLDNKHEASKTREKRKDDIKESLDATERQGSGADEPAEGSSQPPSAQRRRRLGSPPARPKKRSRQLFSGDSNSGLDALATLAASSLELEGLELDAAATFDDKTESVEIKARKQTSPEVTVSKHDLESPQTGGIRDLDNGNMEGEGDHKTEEGEGASEERQPSCSPASSRKRKRKLSGDKTPKVVPPVPEGEAFALLKPRAKIKKPAETKLLSSKQGLKLLKQQSESGVVDGGDSPSYGKQAPMEGGEDHSMDIDESSLPLKLRSKKKGVPEKLPSERTGTPTKSVSGVNTLHQESVRREPAFCPHTTPELGTTSAKAKIIHCICPKVRRWCMCEWFYSAIDLPWFARNEFVEYLNHAGLGHVPRLTRVEWGVIRGSLGKPRRLSKRFLQEEREKLEIYRESVRTHYHELRTGLKEGLPADLARPLTVGQKVIARHPKTREIHDGSILTVDRSRCRVQFDRPELGVELVMDIDAMPAHPLDNMPEVMRRRFTSVEGIDRALSDDSKLRTWNAGVGGAARAAFNERLEHRFTVFTQRFLSDLSKRAQADTLDAVREAKEVTNRAVREAKEVTIKSAVASQRVGPHPPLGALQSQAREADVRALAELSRTLDKKEALVMELRQMNEEASNSREGYRSTETFQRQYATVVLQLKEVNKQVTNALLQLRQRNKYQDNAVPPWYRLNSQEGSDVAEPSEPWALDATPALAEVTVSARKQAGIMVSTAVKAMDGLKAGEDALQKLGCVLEAIPMPGSVSAPQQSSPYSAPSCHEGGALQGASTPGAQPGSRVQSSSSSITEDNSEVDTGTVASSSRLSQADENGPVQRQAPIETTAAHDLGQDLNHTTTQPSASKDSTFPVELMTSCVATLFMLQTLSERPFTSAEIQQTLDTALMTLRPKSAKNHAIYKEIEQQIGTVKAQIMAQIPLPSSSTLSPFLDTMPSSIAPQPTPPKTL